MSDKPAALELLPDDRSAALHGLKPLLARVDRKQPDPAAVRELQHYLDTTPDLWRALGDLARIARDSTLDHLASRSPLSTRMSLEKGVVSLRADLGYAQAPHLEKMLIDHIVLCWIQLNVLELGYNAHGLKRTLAEAAFMEKRLDAAQRRWIRACETLARLRKLAARSPALQVNVAFDGGQQVNLAGDLALSPQAPE